MNDTNDEWFEDASAEEDSGEILITEYDIIAAPNDFNVKTLFDFLDSGVVEIPAFQRNFVWDLRRASKLIESLIIGLPIPQIFLYEQGKNSFLVIDGQQRLLTIYYFFKHRFPKPAKRTALRRKLVEAASVVHSEELLADNEFFTGFKLSLPAEPGGPENPLHGLSYDSLEDLKSQFDLRTIRIVIIKQASPEGQNSIYEIFNRLNSGGINLTPQEIRMSLYHSPFIDMLARVNFDARWRGLVGREDADLHLRDVEFLLRGLALLVEGNDYAPSMTKFLNGFAQRSTVLSTADVQYREDLLGAFFDACAGLTSRAFHGQTGKFTVSIFDAVFAAACQDAYERRDLEIEALDADRLQLLRSDQEFVDATLSRTTGAGNVRLRIAKAREYLKD